MPGGASYKNLVRDNADLANETRKSYGFCTGAAVLWLRVEALCSTV
jgi:hypothetical protein